MGMDASPLVVLFLRWLHILAAMAAIGGAFFMRAALIPAAQESLSDDAHDKLRESLRRRWALVVHVSIVVLLLTGFTNFVMLALPPKIKPMPYHAVFGVKFLLALFVFFIASVLVGRGNGLAGMRKQRAKWLGVLLAAAAAIVLISGFLGQIRTGQAHAATHPSAIPAPAANVRTSP